MATHKFSEMPEDAMYVPLFVGAAGKFDKDRPQLKTGFARDDEGENISSLNPYFCELTGLYWAWKNLQADFIGLVHYRRFFTQKKVKGNLIGSALSYEELVSYLGRYRVFVPEKRRYYIETLRSHYMHTHEASHLELLEKIIRERYPAYLRSYDSVLGRRWGYMFNMMIMQEDLLDKYCVWLFDVLFGLFENVDTESMSAYDKRFPGRIGEILFNVWLDYEIETGDIKSTDIKELDIVEDVAWGKKIKNFLLAKFFNRKYSQSAPAK